MKRTMIAHIVPETESKISGWVERLRDSKYMIFMVVKDSKEFRRRDCWISSQCVWCSTSI